MGYTNIRAKIKWWDPHTKRLRYFSSAKIDDTTINLEKVGHQALILCLAKIPPPFQN